MNQYGKEVKKKLIEKGLNQRYIAEKINCKLVIELQELGDDSE